MPAKNLHILLADDEIEITTLVSFVLQQAGHAVDVAGGGQAALDLLNANPSRYDLVITDSNMPDVSGIQVIEHLRATGFKGKIILLSGDVAPQAEGIYQALNIDAVIGKPFASREILRAVNEAGGK